MIYQPVENHVRYDDVARLRIVAEQGSDPDLYEMAAKGFDALNMPAAAGAMRRKAVHYRSLKEQRDET